MVALFACDDYHDLDGNVINGSVRNCKIIFKGKNSLVTVGEGFRAHGDNCTIVVENNCNVQLGKCFQIGRDSTMFFRDGAQVTVGDYASLGNCTNIYCRGKIEIAENFCMREYSELRVHGVLRLASWVYFQHHVTVYVPRKTEFIVGSDSGMSWYSKVLAGTGHSTYDMSHSIKLEDLSVNPDGIQRLVLGDHVWIGSGATLFNDVTVGDNAVVAANSSVYSGAFPANVMIAGNPAKVVAKSIDWDRRPDLSFQEYQAYKASGKREIKRPSFFDEYAYENVFDRYYMK